MFSRLIRAQQNLETMCFALNHVICYGAKIAELALLKSVNTIEPQ